MNSSSYLLVLGVTGQVGKLVAKNFKGALPRNDKEEEVVR